MQNFNFDPIGIFKGNAIHKYERRRQAIQSDTQQQIQSRQPESSELLARDQGMVQLLPGYNFEQALEGLAGFEYIWLIYLLDRNQGWKPMVRPPGFANKQGVFATRAPYRPNPIGLSAVRLLEIKGLQIHLAEHDLLDGTPILDIKPYLPYSDSFPESKIGWREQARSEYIISFTKTSESQLTWLETHGLNQMRGFIQEQLQFDPTDSRRKRIKATLDHFVLAYRLWRIAFKIVQAASTSDSGLIKIQKIFSNYSDKELISPDNPYSDKELHRQFNDQFLA